MNTIDKKEEPFEMLGNWIFQARALKLAFPQLTEDDLKFETGKENELISRIQNRLKKKKEEVIAIIKKEQPDRL